MLFRALHLLYLAVKSDNLEGNMFTSANYHECVHYQQTQPLMPDRFVAVLQWLSVREPEDELKKAPLCNIGYPMSMPILIYINDSFPVHTQVSDNKGAR